MTGFEPGRVAIVLVVVIGLGVAIDAAFTRASFLDGVALAIMLPVTLVAAWQVVGMWRGTVSHETIARPPLRWLTEAGLERFRAATPCFVIAILGLLIAFAVLVTIGGQGRVASVVTNAGGAVFLVFSAAALVVAICLRPRLLLPATMRPERQP